MLFGSLGLQQWRAGRWVGAALCAGLLDLTLLLCAQQLRPSTLQPQQGNLGAPAAAQPCLASGGGAAGGAASASALQETRAAGPQGGGCEEALFDQIREDLAPFNATGITLQMVEQVGGGGLLPPAASGRRTAPCPACAAAGSRAAARCWDGMQSLTRAHGRGTSSGAERR